MRVSALYSAFPSALFAALPAFPLVLAAVLAAGGCNYMRHPSDATLWGHPAGILVMGLEARGDVINAFIQNRGKTPQRIIARGMTLSVQRLVNGTPSGEAATIVDYPGPVHLDREESFETLAPADYLATPIPITKLGPGRFRIAASYVASTAKAGDWWAGNLAAGPIEVVVE
jgi:hypothetical protein